MSEKEELQKMCIQLQQIEQRCLKAETTLKTIEARNQLLGDSAPLGIFVINAEGCITGINRKMQEIFPRASGKKVKPLDLSANRARIAADIFPDVETCISQQSSSMVDRSYPVDNGSCIHLRYNLNPIPGVDGTVTEVMAIVEDCTDLKRAELALKSSEKRYRQLYQSSPIAMIERDVTQLKTYLEHLQASGISDFRIYLEQNPDQIHHCWSMIKTIDHNPAFVKLMDLEHGSTRSSTFVNTDSEIFRKMAREIILDIFEKKNISEKELPLVTASGEVKYIFGKSMIVPGCEETLERVLVALLDISERRKAEDALRESERRFKDLSFKDNLTGLFNRRYLYQSLAEFIENAKADGSQISLIFMDLDHFKQVVDTHGHLNGSRAIRDVAHTINSCLQQPAFAVAYAGDEFVVVLPGYDQDEALLKANDIRIRMRETNYVLEQNVEVRLAASFGIATFPEDAIDTDALLAAADHALFAVKGSGKNGIGQYTK